MTSQLESKKARVMTEKSAIIIAQTIKKHLDVLENDPSAQRRWIWELLQNAHDASITSDERLIAEIRNNSEELVFFHNGSPFTMEQIYHLIFHGSTKVEDEETIGQYGSGFLTTHILSWNIDVSGFFHDDEDDEDDGWFNFYLKREPKVENLVKSMTHTWHNFGTITSLQVPMPDVFTTCFKYPITKNRAKGVVKQGIVKLTQCAPLVIVFNKVFRRIDINSKEHSETQSFEILQPRLSNVSGLWKINVTRRINENQTKLKYLLAEGEKVSVAAQLRLIGDRPECRPVGDTPRLFAGLPLVGTESFPFPAVINGNREFFEPTEKRDGVLLGLGNQYDTDTNKNNQTVIKEACELLVSLIKNAASQGLNHVHQWAKIPSTEKLVAPEQSWLKNQIKEGLIEKIRKTPAVRTPSGKTIETAASTIPVTEGGESIERLWDILKDRKDYRAGLPKRDESKGWCDVFESWADVYKKDISKVFPEVIDAHALAGDLENYTCLRDLQKLLQEDVSAIEWLDRLYEFLKDNELFDEKIRRLHIFPNQDGEFCLLRDLRLDENVDEELKDIDQFLKREIRKKLRSDALHSLKGESGAGKWNNELVIEQLIDQLQELHDQLQELCPKMKDNFKKAATHLFAWIVRRDRKEYWEYLQDVPVFTADGKSHYSLRTVTPNDIPPFAPVNAWQKDLREFSDIFPKSRILAPEYFEVLSNSNDWRRTNEENIVRIGEDEDIITYEAGKKVNFKDLCLQDDEKLDQQEDREHKTADCIVVTNVKELNSIMDPLRDNQEHAVKFWRFLTEWLIKKDTQGFKEEILECESCTTTYGKVSTHKCYKAAWLTTVRDRRWVRRASPSPKLLADLLRGNELAIRDLSQNPDIDKLLYAIGVPPADLQLDLLAEDPVKRDKAVNFAAEVYGMPEDKIDGAHKVLQYIKEDSDSILKDIEKNENKRRAINENRSVGKQVEEFVGQVLTEKFPKKKFNVKPTHIGADFEIVELEVTQGARKLWIEVKSTRNKSNSQEVKMSSEQAKKAVKKNANFLLCVVPIPESVEIDLETVKENMRFIANIGDRVSQLYGDIDFLEAVQEYITEDLTAETLADVRLTVDSGEIGVLIKNSVWEKNGFPPDELVEHLIRTNNNIVT